MKRLVVDLDGTLTIIDRARSYAEVQPNLEVVEQLRRYHAQGFEIVIATARNMQTHNNSVGKITAKTLPIVIAWLERHGIPYDEIHVGKPWCGEGGFYVDDKAVRPSEFARLSYEEITELLANEAAAATPPQ